MLIFTSPNIFSIQYLIHSQHIAIHPKCIVTIWELPYFRNGRKMRVLLPLWQGAEDRGGPGSASRRGRPVPGLPQRQENAGSAAVVARGGGAGQYGTTVLHRSLLLKGLRRPHPGDLPYGEEGRQGIYQEYHSGDYHSHHYPRQEAGCNQRPRRHRLGGRISTVTHCTQNGRIPSRRKG